MTDHATCPTCGKPLPADAAGGACPRCLLEAGFATGGGAAAPADGAPTPDELAPEFPGLEIEALLGRGGMGVVYRARHRALDREVALKILPPRADAAFAERFQREARALAKLQHPNIVGVHDFGRTAGGTFWLVMEYVDGTNLRQAMRSGALGPKEALAVVPQICDALQYAHEHGVVHRDIKPENVLLDRAGRVKVADFGLAKLMEATPANPALTGAGQVMGTVHYMAPEQWEHPKDVDHRADIYSLGVVFYEMLTGELPLGRFEPPSHKVQVDVRLDEVVLRSLAKEPDRRYQRADEVKTDVGRATTPPDAESRRDDESGPDSTARVVANEDGVTVHVEKDGRTKRVTVGRHGVRVDRGADKDVHVRWPTWARWAIAAGLLLLCGGPLALFSFLLVSSSPPAVREVTPGRVLFLSSDQQDDVDFLLGELANHPGPIETWYWTFYDGESRRHLNRLSEEDRKRLGDSGQLGLPLMTEAARGGKLSEFEVERIGLVDGGPVSVVTLRHRARQFRIQFNVFNEGGELKFTSEPVVVH